MIERLRHSDEGQTAPMSTILKVADFSSSAWYGKSRRKEIPGRRGPKCTHSDEEVLKAIHKILQVPVFYGEGYKKLKKRLSYQHIIVGKERLRRILQENQLLQPSRPKPNGVSRQHTGTIKTPAPDQMYGLDIKEFRIQGVKHYLFSVIDHFNDEIHAWHVTPRADRFAAMEVIRQAVMKRFGSVEQGICKQISLSVRSDNGSQFISKDFRKELTFLGIHLSPAFVRSPECNGIIERFHRIINEQVFMIYAFESINQAKEVVGEFIRKYNEQWLLHRLGLISPIEFRNEFEKRTYVDIVDVASEISLKETNENRERYSDSTSVENFLKNCLHN
jgi:transposase InsO family protein